MDAGDAVDDHSRLRCRGGQRIADFTLSIHRVSISIDSILCDLFQSFIYFFFRLPIIGQIEVKAEEADVMQTMTFEKIDELPSPRVIKSHLPFYLLPPRLVDTCKVQSAD